MGDTFGVNLSVSYSYRTDSWCQKDKYWLKGFLWKQVKFRVVQNNIELLIEAYGEIFRLVWLHLRVRASTYLEKGTVRWKTYKK